MSRYEYLKELEGYLLRHLSREEVSDIMRDYGEYFSDGESQGKSHDEIIAKLGSPKTVAQQIILESKPNADFSYMNAGIHAAAAAKETEAFFKTPVGKIVLVALVIVTAPIWLSAVGAILGAVFATFGILFGIIGGCGCIICAGVILTVISFIGITSVPLSLFFMLLVLSIGLIAGGIFGIAITVIIAKWCWKLLKRFKNFVSQKLHGANSTNSGRTIENA